jgi:hypothetical protein
MHAVPTQGTCSHINRTIQGRQPNRCTQAYVEDLPTQSAMRMYATTRLHEVVTMSHMGKHITDAQSVMFVSKV